SSLDVQGRTGRWGRACCWWCRCSPERQRRAHRSRRKRMRTTGSSATTSDEVLGDERVEVGRAVEHGTADLGVGRSTALHPPQLQRGNGDAEIGRGVSGREARTVTERNQRRLVGSGVDGAGRQRKSPFQGGAAPLHSHRRGRTFYPVALDDLLGSAGGCGFPVSRSVATRDAMCEVETRWRTGLTPSSVVVCDQVTGGDGRYANYDLR